MISGGSGIRGSWARGLSSPYTASSRLNLTYLSYPSLPRSAPCLNGVRVYGSQATCECFVEMQYLFEPGGTHFVTRAAALVSVIDFSMTAGERRRGTSSVLGCQSVWP